MGFTVNWLRGDDLETVLSEALDGPWYDMYSDACHQQMNTAGWSAAHIAASDALWHPSFRSNMRDNIFYFVQGFS